MRSLPLTPRIVLLAAIALLLALLVQAPLGR